MNFWNYLLISASFCTCASVLSFENMPFQGEHTFYVILMSIVTRHGILWVSFSIKVYVQYCTAWPELSMRPSPLQNTLSHMWLKYLLIKSFRLYLPRTTIALPLNALKISFLVVCRNFFNWWSGICSLNINK